MLSFDAARNLLIYETAQQGAILGHIPQARAVGNHHVAVPRNLWNIQVLRQLGLPVVGLIDANYPWPRAPGITPLEHQRVMANFLVSHPHCFNLSDMGTMKTLSTLWACDWLMRQHKEGECRALIVAPLSILDRVWGRTIFENFLGKRSFRIIHGSPAKRERELAAPADFYVINFDGLGVGSSTAKGRLQLGGLSAALQSRSDIRIVVIDEASAYRDSRTRRHKLAKLLFKQREYLWLLTGTPTPNGPFDAFGLAKLVNDANGESFHSFYHRTMTRLSMWKWVPRQNAHLEVRKLLQPAIRYDIKDVWDGPPLTTQQRHVDLTKEQVAHMRKLKSQMQTELSSGVKITPVNEAAMRMKFIQISLGAVYDSTHASHGIDASPRVKALHEVIEQTDGKVLILAPLTNVVKMLYRELEEYPREVVNGETSPKERTRIFNAFQSDESPRLLIADPGVLAHGLDLWRAKIVCWYGPTDKVEQYLQANKRAHRPGQRYPVTVVQLTSTATEREIFRRIANQENLQGVLLNMVKSEQF
ncbi:MAG TPA: DEAD/DEAH box helicase [Candidatus Acidoferrum sp.]